MNLWIVLLFWLSVSLLAYMYVGYPLLIWVAGLYHRPALERTPWRGPISVVIIVHNEAARLARKLDNILASDCAAQICEVIVGSDGSTDGTALVVEAYPDERVRLVAFPERRGRPACLNALVPQCRAEIVVVTDVRKETDSAAIRRLAENFADVRVGAVAGELVRREPAAASSPATPRRPSVLQRYERFLRNCESRFRSVPGATSAFYAIRRNVFQPIAPQIVLDDIAVPMQIISRGYHCAFDERAIEYDDPSRTPRQESERKRRIVAGCVQLLLQYPLWLSPQHNPIWWEFVSHPVLRLFSPWLLIAAALTNALLVRHDPYFYLMALQGVLYLLAALGWHYRSALRSSPVSETLRTLAAFNLTTLAAWWDAVRGRFDPAWGARIGGAP